MKTFTTLALAALFGIGSVAAAPLNGERAVVEKLAAVEKRGDDTVWITVIDNVVKTVDVTTTVWVTPGQSRPTPAAAAPAPVAAKPSHSTEPKPVISPPPAQPKPATPKPAAPIVNPAPAPAPFVKPAPAPAPVVPAAKPSPPAAPSSPPSSGGSFIASGFSNPLPGADESHSCTSSSPCGTPNNAAAKASFYSMTDPVTGAHGLGSCGTFHDALTEDFVAIDSHIMGTLSSGTPMNPLCGLKVTVKNTENGKTATGTVRDTCPGCQTTYGIDLSNHLYDQLAAETEGVFHVEWYFSGN